MVTSGKREKGRGKIGVKEKRGYSDEKIANILAGQLSEAEFKSNADVIIENPDGDKEEISAELQQQIRVLLKDYVESTNKM